MNAPFDSSLAVVVVAVCLAAALATYLRLFARIRQAGGKVRTSEFSSTDLMICFALAGFLAWLVGWAAISHASGKPATPTITPDKVLPAATLFLAPVAGIAVLLWARGVNLAQLFGLAQVSLVRVVVLGIALVLAAFPLVVVSGGLVQLVLRETAQEQELVALFREVTRNADGPAMFKIALAGTIIAPLTEEFLFRGYFYGVFKRFFGPPFAVPFTAILFAAVHLNLTSLPALFVLAICLTLAYEHTGSLLVPIMMHAFFNSTQLALLYFASQST